MTGDDVILAPGDYQVGNDPIGANVGLNIHGVAGQPRPVIHSSADTALQLGSFSQHSVLRDLEIDHSGSLTGLAVKNGDFERVVVHSSGLNACEGPYGGIIRGSVCWNSAVGRALNLTLGGPSPLTLRNFTAVSTGPGFFSQSYGIFLASFGGQPHVVDGLNVIASGMFRDLYAASDTAPGSSAVITMANSNFDTATVDGAASSVSAPGSGSNQIAQPLFADLANADYHEAPGSPTIDAGATDSLLGPADPDGDLRSQGPAPDIGADEAPPDTDPPETTIVKGPKRKTKKRKAKFEFGSDEPGVVFQCKLDKGAFEPCDVAETFKVKRKKHRIEVRAIDAAGNGDPTPAEAAWKVKKKRRKK